MDRQRKRELRQLNDRAWTAGDNVFPTVDSLDSSMKKNTGFIKRLRTGIVLASIDVFLQEVRTLSLHKYLSEIVSACYEGLCKLKTPADIAAGVEVVSALHQRFGHAEFTGYLAWYIGRGLSTPDKNQLKALAQDVREREEKERLARQRVLLRVATELWFVGVLRSLDDITKPEEAKGKENTKTTDGTGKIKNNSIARPEGQSADPFPFEVLKDVLAYDRDHVNLPLLVIFVKAFAWDMLGVRLAVQDGRHNVTEDGLLNGAVESGQEERANDDADPPFAPVELQQRFRNVLTRYFDDVVGHVKRDAKSLAAQSRRNAEAYVKSGEVFEDRQTTYEKQSKAQEKLIASAQIIADVLGADMPDLSEKDSATAAGEQSIGLVKTGEYLRGQSDGSGIWEDEDERRFYENLVDLKDRVPNILLEEPKKKRESDDQVGQKVDTTLEVNETAPEPKALQNDDQSTSIANKSVGAQVDSLLAKLPELTSKEAVDQAAMDFCFLNSKASRNRLIKAVQEVPKGRSDLLPLYARLVATLGRYMPDISAGLVAHLDDEFRSLQRRKSKEFLGQVRMVNVRYLAELTKFGTVPEHVIFHCLKVSLDNFSRMNIEIICNLLENCGRYLLRNPDTSPRMSSFLDTLLRKKAAQHLGQQERMLIENATYYVNPPERAAIQQKERTPLDLFLQKILHIDLSKRNIDKVVKQIRKLHWEEAEVVDLLEKFFSKPGKIKYSNIHLLAVILSSLNRHHQDFAVTVIDNLLESITFGLEINDFNFNQRRLAEVKYLAELYIYRMVDSPVIFETLYRIMTHGHVGGIPKPDSINTFDLPDDFFRIRLVCSLLETCGVYYDKGTARKKLDFFLAFFQYYIQTKDTLPMDIEFVVLDAFAAVRPNLKLASSLEEAGKAFAEACKENYKNEVEEKGQETEEVEEDSLSDDGVDDDDVPLDDLEDEVSNDDEDDANDDHDEAIASNGTIDDDEHIVVTRPDDERDPEADAEFDRELAKMMTESLDSRKLERRTVFDVPLPMRRVQKDSTSLTRDADASDTETPSAPTEAPEKVKFSLLSKRGNRQQTRSIDLPASSNFAIAMRTQQEAERAEQKRIKDLVLNLDLREDNEPDGESTFPLTPNDNRQLLYVNRMHRDKYSTRIARWQAGDRLNDKVSHVRDSFEKRSTKQITVGPDGT